MIGGLVFLVLFAAGCSTTRTVPAGEYLYKGAAVAIEAPDSISTKEIKSQLEGLISPRPNRKLLGIPWRLYFYNIFVPKKEKGLTAWLQRTLGEAPVLYDPQISRSVSNLMDNRLTINGYFDGELRIEVDTSKRKKARITYLAQLKAPPYTLRKYQLSVDHPRLRPALADLPPSKILQAGKRYSLDDLKRERSRIEDWLKEKGYYYFEADFLEFKGDSTVGNHQIDLVLGLKEDIPEANLKPMTIERVYVFPDFDIEQTGIKDSLQLDNIQFFYQNLEIRPQVVLNAIQSRPGDQFEQERLTRTRKRLLNLPYFQFVNIRINRSPLADSLLDMRVLLTPRLPNTIEGTIGLSHKSTQFLGPEASLTYTNRNLFRGSELFRLTGSATFNFPLSDNISRYYEEIRGEARFTRPGLLLPFLKDQTRSRLIASGTSLKLIYNREKARFPIYTDNTNVADLISILRELNLDNLADKLEADSTYASAITINEPQITFGYSWKRRESLIHEINPLNFRFQFSRFEDPELEALLILGALLNGQNLESVLNLQRMFVFQPEYIFLYDGRREQVRRHNFFYRNRTSIAGNEILPIKNDLINRDTFNLESQYLQSEHDFRYFLTPNAKNTLAFRWVTEVSFPLSNQLILPFIDLYTVGGPNSVRAFITRGVGPGTTNPDSVRYNLLQGKGDIHLEASIEYRHRLGSYFELAPFLDAGNVWLFKQKTTNEVAGFSFSNFYKELAVGAGLGFRLSLSSLVLRLDLAIPLTIPWEQEGNRWLPDGIRFGDPDWRQKYLTWHVAFGYPF